MRKLTIALYLLTLSGLVLMGCSDNNANSPTTAYLEGGNPAPAFSKTIGPSDIVLCLDVSDSVSQDQLQSAVTALSVNLADPELFPQDGSMSVAVLVFGDTLGFALDTATPVDPTNLADIIVPALEGLLTDRLVGTGGADLASALSGAQAFLETGVVTDRHILILGSGSVADETAAQDACAEVAAAGIMVSALAFGDDETVAAVLQDCAAMSGGYFGLGGSDFTAATTLAFSYMLKVQFQLEPRTADLARGQEHTVSAAVFRGEDSAAYPLEGRDVVFSLASGPNQGDPITAVTDNQGMAYFTFTGAGGPGQDTIVAETVHPGTGLTLTDTVTVNWLNSAPVCDAGGPYAVSVDSETMLVTLDGSLSSDADEDSLSFHWSISCEDAQFEDPAVEMPVLQLTGSCLCADTLLVTLMVTDGFDTTSCDAVLTLDDQRPWNIEVREDPFVLWPGNHKYREITVDMMFVSAEDACGNPIDLSEISVVEVRSDEPEDAGGNGDGHTLADMVIQCPNTVSLRAERAGRGNGRVYTIVYRVPLADGEFMLMEGRAVVPHDQSGDEAIEDAGAGYTVESDCD